MSHSKIRTEKVCLNCGTETPGRYCPACGQENIEPKQTVWHLIQHFFSDITHFDGKFFLTVKDLFAKPGFLSKEYMIGRRASYLDPVRMYIFTSAIFFLITFSLADVKHLDISSNDIRQEMRDDPEFQALIATAKTAADSLRILKNYQARHDAIVRVRMDTVKNKEPFINRVSSYSSPEEYDSVQKVLPREKKDGWMKKRIIRRIIVINQRYDKVGNDLIREFAESLLHYFPKMLFISLPAFAFLLKLLYYRRRNFYYVDHGIFSVHLYIFSFLIMLIIFGVNSLRNFTGFSILGWLQAALIIYPFIYYYKAMRRFYGQGRWKTFFKYCMLFMLSFFVQLLILIGALTFTFFEA